LGRSGGEEEGEGCGSSAAAAGGGRGGVCGSWCLSLPSDESESDRAKWPWLSSSSSSSSSSSVSDGQRFHLGALRPSRSCWAASFSARRSSATASSCCACFARKLARSLSSLPRTRHSSVVGVTTSPPSTSGAASPVVWSEMPMAVARRDAARDRGRLGARSATPTSTWPPSSVAAAAAAAVPASIELGPSEKPAPGENRLWLRALA